MAIIYSISWQWKHFLAVYLNPFEHYYTAPTGKRSRKFCNLKVIIQCYPMSLIRLGIKSHLYGKSGIHCQWTRKCSKAFLRWHLERNLRWDVWFVSTDNLPEWYQVRAFCVGRLSNCIRENEFECEREWMVCSCLSLVALNAKNVET